jgi:uncharacterized membrane protein
VSLEAIFLSTFVMISQNRAGQKRAVLASEAWESVQLEEKQNEELLQLSQQIPCAHRRDPQADGRSSGQGVDRPAVDV